jgi:hypothetical protein
MVRRKNGKGRLNKAAFSIFERLGLGALDLTVNNEQVRASFRKYF